jgi:hypothetical protein
MGEMRNTEISRNRSLGRPMRILESNIKIDLKEVDDDGLERVKLAQDNVQWLTFVNTAMNIREP